MAQKSKRSLAANTAFRENYHSLHSALAVPDVTSGLASKLYERIIITAETRDAVQLTSGITPWKNAAILLQAVESSIKMDPQRLQQFIQILKNNDTLKPIAIRLHQCYISGTLVSEAGQLESCSSESDTNLEDNEQGSNGPVADMKDYLELKKTRNTLSDFRFNLLSICPNLSDKDVEDLVYLSPELEFPEDIQDGREYLEQLERKGLISPSNYDYLLDRLTQIQKEDLAIQLMKYSCQSPHTPSRLSTRLMACLLDSGKEDLVVQIMKCKCHVPRLPSGLSESSITLAKVFTTKQRICRAHMHAIEKLCDPVYAKETMRGLLEEHFRQSVLQSTKIDMEATVYQWSNLSVFENRGTLGELLENTLESIFSFADAYRMYVGSIVNSETVQLQTIRPSAKICKLTFDTFSEDLADSEWNHSGINQKTRRDFQLQILADSACKAIVDLCEGLCCGKKLEEVEDAVKEEFSTIVTGMYACWYSTPMYHWMRTLIQMAASSKLDLTKHHDRIIQIVSVHREPIIKYYSKFTQLLGSDVMKMVDPVLNMPQHRTELSKRPTTTPTMDNCVHEEYMAVNWYMYLLQLVALTGSNSSSQWEMAERFAKIHHEFHERLYGDIIVSSMEITGKLITTGHVHLKNFKQQVIRLCPESSTERVLLSQLLSDVNTHK